MKEEKILKKILKRVLIITFVLMVVLGTYLWYVFHTYYRLPDSLTLEVNRSGSNTYFDEDFGLKEGGDYLILTYNIGFGAYRKDFSFFMDGGKSSWAEDEESVLAGVSSMGEIITNINPDFILLQEVDRDSTRSYHVDELELLNQFVRGYYYDFAQNYDSPFLFFPPWQPHGASKSGLVTYSREEIKESMRRSLPVSESFSKFLDLDRCYSISRITTENDKQLCIYNIHMSAYGSNDAIREGQLATLYQDMEADYERGNYVICGGDFNHNLKSDNQENAPEWAYPFPKDGLPEGFHMAIDSAKPQDVEHNSCRNANEPYEEGHTYTVTLDGFIVSDNVEVNFYNNMDWGYEFSDHDPVLMQFILR